MRPTIVSPSPGRRYGTLMATYRIEGRSPQIPDGVIRTAKTAAGAIQAFISLKGVCGSVTVTDGNGALSFRELNARRAAEQA